MAPGRLKASRTLPLPARVSSGFVRASSAAAPITGAVLRCALLPSISSPPRAMKTGKLTLMTGAMAREIIVNKEGKAEGVSYIDKATRTEKRIYARAIVVAASACESARLLLNSKSTAFPAGIANSSGTVGRYLTDSVGSSGSGYFPQLEKMPPHNHDGVGGMHMYMPWWKFDRKNDFPRGYHIEFGGGREMPGVRMLYGLCRHEEDSGATLK